jgi:hypothetical protein
LSNKSYDNFINEIAVSEPPLIYFLFKYFCVSESITAPYGGFPITTSKPPLANTSENSVCQLKAFSPGIPAFDVVA